VRGGEGLADEVVPGLVARDSDNPPLRLFLGESPLRIAVEDYGSRLATWAHWQQVAAAAQGT